MINWPFHANARADHTGSPRPCSEAFSAANRFTCARRRFFQEARHRQPADARDAFAPRKSFRHRAALDQYANEVCLIEADREREKERLNYCDFKERALLLSKALQDGGFSGGARASIIMTNQSKWLISAYAIFFTGGVLVPLDYKL